MTNENFVKAMPDDNDIVDDATLMAEFNHCYDLSSKLDMATFDDIVTID